MSTERAKRDGLGVVTFLAVFEGRRLRDVSGRGSGLRSRCVGWKGPGTAPGSSVRLQAVPGPRERDLDSDVVPRPALQRALRELPRGRPPGSAHLVLRPR